VESSTSRIWALAEPVAAGLGLEILEIEVGGGSSRQTVRIYLDSPDPERSVTLADCETVSRSLGDLLDAHAAVRGHYMLEVSSPGLNRPLRKVEHFARVVGGRIRVRTRQPHDGRRNFVGRLEEVDPRALTMKTDDGETVELKMTEIDKANFEYAFEDTDRPKRKKR
jgi:ribosome maturation factor RimP